MGVSVAKKPFRWQAASSGIQFRLAITADDRQFARRLTGMAFADFPQFSQSVALLQRSLDRGRLGHAYLFIGARLDDLGPMARNLAKTLNCTAPPRQAASGLALDCCDRCLNCRKIDGGGHADVHWLRPESKSRLIRVEPLRDLLHELHLKAHEARYKVAIISAADRMNEAAANAFLKTLEEPPPGSVLILLTTEPQRLLETVLSRCLRLSFGGAASQPREAAHLEVLEGISGQIASTATGLLPRYRILDSLTRRLAEMKKAIADTLEKQSPLTHYPDATPDQKERWEDELDASTEAEYRRQRADLLNTLHWWLRDIWLLGSGMGDTLLGYPEFRERSDAVARRISPDDALTNLQTLETTQRLLMSNVQEALALEVCLIKLRL